MRRGVSNVLRLTHVLDDADDLRRQKEESRGAEACDEIPVHPHAEEGGRSIEPRQRCLEGLNKFHSRLPLVVSRSIIASWGVLHSLAAILSGSALAGKRLRRLRRLHLDVLNEFTQALGMSVVVVVEGERNHESTENKYNDERKVPQSDPC